MTPDRWQPISTLQSGHYATGLFSDGSEHGIFNDGRTLWNVATGDKADSVTHWRASPREPQRATLF